MSKTKLLYLEDSYLREVATTVFETFKDSVVLDETIFYPEGGGQPTDIGRLDSPVGTADIVLVQKVGNRIHHYLEGQMPGAGNEVFLRLNWERRFAHMRMHTAQHIVSRIVFDQFGAQTAGNQIHAEYSHIDFAPATFQAEDLPAIEKAANEIIHQNLPVIIEMIPRDKLELVMGPDRSDLSKLPSSVKQVRMVRVGDYDSYPCAGTHVATTGELISLLITKRKSKGKGKVRITYTLGMQEV